MKRQPKQGDVEVEGNPTSICGPVVLKGEL